MQTNQPHRFSSLSTQELRRLKLAGIIALAVALVVVTTGIISRANGASTVQAWTNVQAIPSVSIITPVAGGAFQEVTLPSTLQAYNDAAIYARVGGYLKGWYVDIGTKVKKGQLLADIDAPDLDQQLIQGKADLASAVSNLQLATITAGRWQNLLKSDGVSKQEYDEKNGDLRAKTSAVASARANVDRLQALASFKRIVAPFDGVITTRKTDIGALINAGSSNAPALFSVADVHKLRVYVDVPQSYMASIKTGTTANLSTSEYPDRTFVATMVGTSESVSASSGTLLVQLEVDNTENLLTPGAYAEVHFKIPANSGAIRIPSSTLMFRQQGLSVAVLGNNNRVKIHPIVLAQDNGTDVEVRSGINASDQIIDNPSDSLSDGDLVQKATLAKVAMANTAHGLGDRHE